MAVYIANLQIDTGVNFQHGFSLGDNDTGTYLNLNNYTVNSQMRKWAGSTSSVSFASTVTDAEQGQLQISLGSTETTDIKPGRYMYDVLLEDAGGFKYKVVEGMALVRAGKSSLDSAFLLAKTLTAAERSNGDLVFIAIATTTSTSFASIE